MAEAPSLYAESLEKLDQELTCPICLKHFEEPKVLQCCHYYCRECIIQMRARTKGKDYFQCPECRKEIRLPGDDPESLPTAFFVNRMKEVFSTMQKAQGKVELTCENCHRATTPVEAFCRHCALFICQHCEEHHRTMRVFSDHVVVPLDDLRQNTAAHLPLKEETQIRCKEHDGKKMKLYCYDCKQLICRDCIVIDHKGHKYNFVNKVAVQCRTSLKESVAPLRETQVNVSQVLKEVESMESKLDNNSTTVARDIDRSIDELISLLQKHKEQLHHEAEQMVESKRKTLVAQKKNIHLVTAEIQSLLDFVDHKSQQASDQEVLGLQKQIIDRAEEVVQKYGNPKKQFGPIDVPCLEVQFSIDIGRKVKKMISISEKTAVKGQLVDVKSEGNLGPGPNAPLLPSEGHVTSEELGNTILPDPQVVTSSQQFDQPKEMLVESSASQPASSISAKVKFSHREEVIALPGGRKLTLKKADIVEEKVDIIVNATNSHLQHGDGVAQAINSASHGEVQKYSNRYTMRRGPVPVGQVAYTNAGGNLKCKLVFHAVGPDSSYTATECERLLIQVVNLALLRAEKTNHTSIAIPAISSGIFGVNKDLVARCVIDTILNFHFTRFPPVLSDIRIVIIDSPTYSCFAQYFVQKQMLLKQASRKPLDPVEFQSAGIGQLGPPNTIAAPTSEPSPLEGGKPQGQLVDVASEGNSQLQKNTPPTPLEEKTCPICLDGLKAPTKTKCGHQFCSACLSKALQYDPYCPTCKHVLRPIVGKQPRGGQMTHRVLYRSLPGYEGYNTIEICYDIPGGIQSQEHPNPGRPFSGTSRTAYLPDTYEGREVLELLKKAFDARLTFTVGNSVTSGVQNTVIWNGIHHKTSMYGGAQGYGYPDPNYLRRVKEDLAAKGIVPDGTF